MEAIEQNSSHRTTTIEYEKLVHKSHAFAICHLMIYLSAHMHMAEAKSREVGSGHRTLDLCGVNRWDIIK